MNSPTSRLIALRERIRSDFQELPGLCLTPWQAARLWRLDPMECHDVMRALVAARMLRECRAGFVAGELCGAPRSQRPGSCRAQSDVR
jgi:hypothetical protein